MSDDALKAAIWQWLPSRPDRRRCTRASIIAVNLGEPTSAISLALSEMESAGHAIRDRRGDGWHRGTPPQEKKC